MERVRGSAGEGERVKARGRGLGQGPGRQFGVSMRLLTCLPPRPSATRSTATTAASCPHSLVSTTRCLQPTRDALIAALAPCSTPRELWTSIIIDAVPLFESAFSMSDLFDGDACRLLAARARFAADLSRSTSASTLDAISARPPTHIDVTDLTVATAAHAVARLTNRVAFET